MNDRHTKTKKHSNAHARPAPHPHIDKYPSASSIRLLQGHCQPKNPPNINLYQHYAHPRRHDEQKENHRPRENNHHVVSVRQQTKTKNVLLMPRKSNQGDEGLRKTQKRMRNRPLRSEFVSPDEEGLGCHQNLSSQIFRQSGNSSLMKRKRDYASRQNMSAEQLINDFQRKLPTLAQKKDEEELAEMIKLEEQYTRMPHYADYLQKQYNITWKKRAMVLDWAMLAAQELSCRRQTFATCVNLLDRYLAASAPIPEEKLQLSATVCLHLAEKLDDQQRLNTYNIFQKIDQRFSFEEIHQQQMEVASTLKFKFRAPTINSWANRLCKQWDIWTAKQALDFEVRFKTNTGDQDRDPDCYHNWRWLIQYIDLSLLDIQTLQYKSRTVAAAFLYLTLLMKLEIHSAEEIVGKFRKESRHITDETPFNALYSRFLFESFGFPLVEILPTVQYCSGFILLPLNFNHPKLFIEKEMYFEDYCSIQTYNESNMRALNSLDRSFW